MANVPFQKAIVVGASTGIGAEVARQFVALGVEVALIARRETELATLTDELNRSGPGKARYYVHDVLNTGEVPELFQRICRDMEGLDLIVYAAGIMYPIGKEEYSFEKDKSVIDINLTGCVAWLNPAAERFMAAKAGTIVGISSVAGERGRRPTPVYGAAKAAVNTYLESLRNRLGQYGVSVVTIKPGPVETRMTAGMTGLPFLISAPDAARYIVNAARNKAHTAFVPPVWRFAMFAVRNIPSFIFKKMDF